MGNLLKDVSLTIQYTNQKPIEVNTHHIQEDVLRMKMGLVPHGEDCNNPCSHDNIQS